MTVYLPPPPGVELPTMYRQHRQVLRAIVEHHARPEGVRVKNLPAWVPIAAETAQRYVRELRWMGYVEAHTTAPTFRKGEHRLSPYLRRILERIKAAYQAGTFCSSGTLAASMHQSREGMSVRVSELRRKGFVRPHAHLWPTPSGVHYVAAVLS